MNKNIFLILFVFSFVIIGCQKNTSSKKRIDGQSGSLNNTSKLMSCDRNLVNDSIVHKLSPAQLLVRFDDKYPIGVDIVDSFLYALMVNSDTAVYVYNKHTLDFCKAFGYVGRGPQDVLSPSFVKNNYEIKRNESSLEFYDLNARKIFKNVGDSIVSTREFIGEMYPSDQLNISGDYWIGRKLRGTQEELFQIYNSRNQEVKATEIYPLIPDLDEKIDKSRLYSVTLACNRSKDRIVVGMYCFDLILVYNFMGELLKSVSISDNYNSKDAVQNMIHGDEYIGYSQVYATDDYCYLRRCLKGESGNRKMKASHILRVDWNGNIAGIYNMDEYTTAEFCVDEVSGELYCISHKTDNDKEYYDVVSYKL